MRTQTSNIKLVQDRTNAEIVIPISREIPNKVEYVFESEPILVVHSALSPLKITSNAVDKGTVICPMGFKLQSITGPLAQRIRFIGRCAFYDGAPDYKDDEPTTATFIQDGSKKTLAVKLNVVLPAPPSM